MDYPVIADGNVIGNCSLEEQGLYWQIQCICRPRSDRVERLYCGSTKLGVLLLEGANLVLKRRVSRTSMPMLPPSTGVFSLEPAEEACFWEGALAGIPCTGFCAGERLLFPYEKSKPCPCEPLFCFFEISDGFWKLPMKYAAEL